MQTLTSLPAADQSAKPVAKEFLSFRLGAEEYGIDILAVREIRAYERPTRIANTPDYIRGVINLRGAIVPIVDLRIKLGQANPAYDSVTVVIILNIGGRMTGVVVDSVSDVIALTPDQIRPAPDFHASVGTSAITGLASLGENLLILVDIAAFMADADIGPVAAAA